MRQLLLALLLTGSFAVVRHASAPAQAAEGDAPAQGPAYRITSTFRPVQFPLPGESGSVALSPDTSVIVNGRRPAGPWRVTLERGEGAMTVPQSSAAAGSTLGGVAAAIQVSHGTSVFWRRAEGGAEGGLLFRGQAQLARFPQPAAGATRPTSGVVSAPMPSGQHFTVVGADRVAWADVKAGGAGWMEALAQGVEKAQGDQLVRLPITVPPSRRNEPNPDPSVKLRPLTMGTATLALPSDKALQASEQLTRFRDRMLLTVPGKGMGGPALYMDASTSNPGRLHNTLWSGGRGYVRFYMQPDWKVTMAPGSLVELDSPDMVAPGESMTPRLKLHRGAIMCEGEMVESAPRGPPGLPPIDGLVVSGEASPVVGNKAVVFASHPDPKSAPAQVLADARDLFRELPSRRPADGGAGSVGAGAITLLAHLPAPSRGISQYVPLQATLPGAEPRVDLTMMGSPPPDDPEVPVRALEVYLADPVAGPLPVALVIPVNLKADPGAGPEELKVLMVPRSAEARVHLREVFERWRQLAGFKNPEPKLQKDQELKWISGVVVAMVLLLVFGGAGRKLEKIAESVFGLVRTRCPRCDLILDQIPITEVGTREEQEPVFALVDFDNLTDANRQNKSKVSLFEWMRARLKRKVAESYRFRVHADWCPRCLQGSFTSEVLNHGSVMDESSSEYSGADTHELLLSLRKPDAAPPAPGPSP